MERLLLREAGTLEPAQMGRDHPGGNCGSYLLLSRHRKAQAAVISNVSLTHMQYQPQDSHSNNICHIPQESKHNHIISIQHKARFILGIQTTTGFYPEQISRLLINSSHRCIYAKTPQAVFLFDQQT